MCLILSESIFFIQTEHVKGQKILSTSLAVDFKSLSDNSEVVQITALIIIQPTVCRVMTHLWLSTVAVTFTARDRSIF